MTQQVDEKWNYHFVLPHVTERSAGFHYLLLSLQGLWINLADVVGFRGCVIVISIFNEIARPVICEVRHCVVEKGNRSDEHRIRHVSKGNV